ncbi:MAG: hypothetical protein ACYCOR_04705 [Acidobacteriaceae bacterium]
MTKTHTPSAQPDADSSKGVVEDDSPRQPGKARKSQESMAGQLGHRNADELTSGSDSDFPEPGPRPEHSGEHK